MKKTQAKPNQKKVQVVMSAIPELQRLGWVTETKKDGTTTYTIALPTAAVIEESSGDDWWPEILVRD